MTLPPLKTTLRAALAVTALAAFPACNEDESLNNPPKIYFASSGDFEIAPGDTLMLEPRIIYDYDSRYAWYDAEGNILSNERDYLFVTSQMKDYKFFFSIENSAGADTFAISVSVQLRADFDELDNFSTKKKSVLALLPDTLPGAFRWNGLELANAINADTSMWYGFAFSNKATSSSTQASAVIGTAYVSTSSTSSSNAYMAVCAPSSSAKVLFPRAYTPKSVDLANDNFIYLASKFGFTTADSVFVSPATFADYYTVLVEGLDENGMRNGASVSLDLVDCNYDNPAKYLRSTKWNTLELSELGQVHGLLFSVKTSLTGFPPLFCIDNLRLQD
ncbi:MAG: DUF4465 domain-containing protein [Bacteroidales bacterium]|nr:DUF4465 domain-containing protein [Bacteroidales bacterium]